MAMNSHPHFQAYEILCIEHEASCLYAELIQTVEPRQLCWVRPIVLRIFSPSTPDGWDDQDATLYDLRQDSDLLLPSCLFRTALDTEVIPLLTALQDFKTPPDGDRQAHHQLQSFVWRLWHANSSAFP
jgi:hypothetical protein